ncbi:MAG: hypothetical protein M1828_001901 [Chrysothrix sp. TS-e1954]|nr:MAG: hypothetical protein M1828_001901 [Chrysothrix sp. TS-e1954]
MYDSTINFTLDTICPWTYIAKKRLEAALAQVRADNPPVTFSVHYNPYQLFSDAPEHGEDKYEWYKKNKYNDSDDQMKRYTTYMSAMGVGNGIDFKFGGTIASTLNAHRVMQHFQEEKGAEVADKIVNSLYRQYFEEEKHPSNEATLLAATQEAGIPDAEAEPVINDQDEGLQDVKMMIREQTSNGVDAVPYITVEGKRRDFTLEGAKEVTEYVKTLNQVIKESN